MVKHFYSTPYQQFMKTAKYISLNDFHWSSQLIPSHNLLLMLEGHVVHLPAPKMDFARDISLAKDTPVFCTGKSSLVFIKNGVIHEDETEMMATRWLNICLPYQIEQDKQRVIPPCSKCFSFLIWSAKYSMSHEQAHLTV